MSFNERRKSPRVEVDLPVSLEGAEGEISGRALNISTTGIYFELPHYIEPMTKIRMGLSVPASGEGTGREVVQFDGVVVRTEPESPEDGVVDYRMAVFFTSVPEKSLEALTGFISSKTE